jgi:hypothetical protein
MTQYGSIYGPKAKLRPSMDADELESTPAKMLKGRAVGTEASQLVEREHFAEEAGYASVATVIRNRPNKDAGAIPFIDSKAAALEAEAAAGGEATQSEIQDVLRVPGSVPRDGCLGIKPGRFGPSGNPVTRRRAIPGDTLATIIDSVPTAAVHG